MKSEPNVCTQLTIEFLEMLDTEVGVDFQVKLVSITSFSRKHALLNNVLNHSH